MKFLSIILVVLSFCSYANAETWSTTFSGSLSNNATRYHYFVFPAAGTATISCSKTYSGSTGFVLVGYLQHSGQSVTLGSAPFTVSNQAVWPDETYAVYMMCPHGDGGYYGSVVQTYSQAPVILSKTATPISAVYGESVTVSVSATDINDDISYVQFVNGSVKVNDSISPYTHIYSGLAVGTYTINVYAVDATGLSNDVSVKFSITSRPISVRPISGCSTYGVNPIDQGIDLLSGALVYGDTLTGIGLHNNRVINATTVPGTYLLEVLENPSGPSNYSVGKSFGVWTVLASNNSIVDADGDGIDDRLEWKLFEGYGISNSDSALYVDTDGDLYSRMMEIIAQEDESSFNTSADGATWSDVNNKYGNASSGSVVVVLPDRGMFAADQPDLNLGGL